MKFGAELIGVGDLVKLEGQNWVPHDHTQLYTHILKEYLLLKCS